MSPDAKVKFHFGDRLLVYTVFILLLVSVLEVIAFLPFEYVINCIFLSNYIKLDRNDCIYDDFYSYFGKSVPLSSYVTLKDLFAILCLNFSLHWYHFYDSLIVLGFCMKENITQFHKLLGFLTYKLAAWFFSQYEKVEWYRPLRAKS